MDWLNENSGIIILIVSVVIIALIALTIWLLLRLHSKIAVQRLNFLGFYSVDKDTKECYACMTIGNKSLNDVGIGELGVQNGKVNYPLTEKYKKDKNMQSDARIVIEQRSSITFNVSCDELRSLVIETNGKQIVKTLRVYAVDLTGTLYRGRISAVRKLLKEMLAAEKQGLPFRPSVGAAKSEAAATEEKETERLACDEAPEAPSQTENAD